MNTLSDLMFADRKDIYLSSFHIKDNLFETICIKKLKAKIFDWRKRKIISLLAYTFMFSLEPVAV